MLRKAVTSAVLFVSVLLLTACPRDVEQGTLRDMLFSVEETENGNWRVFLVNDSAAGYCTVDPTLGQEALNLLKTHNGEVLISFRKIHSSDDEWAFLSESDCGSITKAGYEMEMFYLDDISPVSSRYHSYQ